MSDDRKDRVERLGQRFSDRGAKSVATPPLPTQPLEDKKERRRRTFYIDKRLITRLDQAFPKFSYEINPKVIEKSDFLELLLEYALDNLDDLKNRVE